MELEKLLPKKRFVKSPERGGGRLDLIKKDGHSFLITKDDKDNQKIFGFRRWEQAFRVYAHIYSNANPHRCGEIWQYIDSIHSASTTFLWDNVANYDFSFRKIMEDKPQRCWGTTNTQLWTMCMREHVRSNYSQGRTFGSHGKKTEEAKEAVCWKFNKNRCKRSADFCRFEHKCAYCFSTSHGSYACPKKRKTEENQQPGGKTKEKGHKEGNESNTNS